MVVGCRLSAVGRQAFRATVLSVVVAAACGKEIARPADAAPISADAAPAPGAFGPSRRDAVSLAERGARGDAVAAEQRGDRGDAATRDETAAARGLAYAVPRPGRAPVAPSDLGPPVRGETIAIPGGTYLRGSTPGIAGRDPAREVDLVPTEVAPFEIDRLAFPNDPARSFTANVTAADAARQCESTGKRLCTEVEWEFACAGLANQTYPYGDDYDADRYESPEVLMSPFGVAGMTAIYEWTAGDWLDGRGRKFDRVGPVRGAHPSEGDAATRRCAARTGLDPASRSPRVGFRCCRGAGFAGSYEVDAIRRAFEPGPMMTDPMFAELVRSIPELWRVHSDPRIQSEETLRRGLLRSRREQAVGPGFVYSIQPVLWRPADGEELIGIVGRSGSDVFTAALYTTGVPGYYVHAASMVLTGVAEDDGIILYGGLRARTLLGWGSCDDCMQGGSYEYLKDRSIRVGHRW